MRESQYRWYGQEEYFADSYEQNIKIIDLP
jgi:hypothetical protein